jgi:hypothetical protein
MLTIAPYEYKIWFPSHPFTEEVEKTIRFNHLVYNNNFTDNAADRTKKLFEHMHPENNEKDREYHPVLNIYVYSYKFK